MELNDAAEYEFADALGRIKEEIIRRAIFRAQELNLEQVNAQQIRDSVQSLFGPDRREPRPIISQSTTPQPADIQKASIFTPIAAFFVSFGGVLLGIAAPDLVEAIRAGGQVDLITVSSLVFGLFFTLAPFVEWFLARSPKMSLSEEIDKALDGAAETTILEKARERLLAKQETDDTRVIVDVITNYLIHEKYSRDK